MLAYKPHSILGFVPMLQVMDEVGFSAQDLLARHQLKLDNLTGAAVIDLQLEFSMIAEGNLYLSVIALKTASEYRKNKRHFS